MGLVIFAGLLFLIGTITFFGCMFGAPRELVTEASRDRYGNSVPRSARRNYGRIWGMIAAPVIALIIPAAIIGLAGNHSVPTKSVGVLTSFGKVVGQPYGPGSHWFAPWQTLNIVTDTIQSDSFLQSYGQGNSDSYSNSGAKGYCIPIRLGGQQQGCADVQLQTQVQEGAIPQLYANYNSYGPNLTQDVDQYVVKRELTTALNRVLGDYNPILDVTAQLTACALNHQTTSCNTSSAASQFSQFDPQLVTELQNLVGPGIKVSDVNLQLIHYDDTTEQALQKIQNEYSQIAVATLLEQENTATSAANAALDKNNTLTPQILANECYTTTQDAIKAGYSLPAGWTCSGTSPSLLVQGK